MLLVLRIYFAVVLIAMLGVTGWAGAQVPLWEIPRSVGGHPWFIATLFDAYFGFFAFYLWQWYKEPSWPARGLWLVALLLLGNIAMAVYGLIVTFRGRPTGADPRFAGGLRSPVLEAVLLRGAPVPLWVPAALIAALLAVAALAAMR